MLKIAGLQTLAKISKFHKRLQKVTQSDLFALCANLTVATDRGSLHRHRAALASESRAENRDAMFTGSSFGIYLFSCQKEQSRVTEATTILRFTEAEVIHRRSWKSRQEVELATLDWVHWSNYERLLGSISNIPPAEAEAAYYQHSTESAMAA